MITGPGRIGSLPGETPPPDPSKIGSAMARRTSATKASESTDTPSPTPFILGEVRQSEGLSRTRGPREDNPLTNYVSESYQSGAPHPKTGTWMGAWREFDVVDEDAAKRAVAFLIRAADDLKHGLEKDYASNGANFTVRFRAKDRRQKRYSDAEIRVWAESTHWGTINGTIPKDVREEFRRVHGFEKATVEEMNNQ